MALSGRGILAVAGDPGGAAALAPVLVRLDADPTFTLEARAYREAARLWSGRGFRYSDLPGDLDDRALETLARCSDLLLVGNSAANGIDFEKRLIAIFAASRRPTLALLDYWSNYARRFSGPDGSLACVPDRIAAIDEVSRSGLIAAGIPSERIVVTGHPAFDTLSEHPQTAERVAAVRRALGVTADEKLVLFAAHPDVGGESDAAIALLYDALRQVARDGAAPIALVVRPHPKSSGPKQFVARAAVDGVRLYACSAGEARDAVVAADAVAGVETMLLAEARYLGRPTVSIQTGGRTLEAPVPSVRDRAELAEFLAAALAPGGRSPAATPPALPGGATSRVVSLIESMLEPTFSNTAGTRP